MAKTTTLAQVRLEHIPRYSRRRLGNASVSGRPLYGWSVECSCGTFSRKSNEPKGSVEQDWREHTREVWENLRLGNAATTHTVSPTADLIPPDTAAQRDFQRWHDLQRQVKTCPCCGSRATWIEGEWVAGSAKDDKTDSVTCSGCGLLMMGTTLPGSALSKWNTRA